MANNRMYLRCKDCGETFFLGKRFGGGYHIAQYEQYKGVPLIDRLNKFYSDHEWCKGGELDCFELVYEEPPEHTKTDSEKLVFLIGELRTLYLILARSIDAIEELEKCSISKDSFVSLSTGIKEGYKEVWEYIGHILKEI